MNRFIVHILAGSLLLMSGILCNTAAACTQTRHAPSSSDSSARILAQRLEGDEPFIDGRLTEACWRSATPATAFLQREPVEGAPSTLRTEVRFCYDDRALYIAAVMFVDDPVEIQSTMSRRDNTGNSARIIISLDTYKDRRTAYTFGVTADGVRFDYYHAADQEHARDYSFDPVWEARVQWTDSAWVAEMRIPFSQLRFSEAVTQTWGLNINRYIPSRNEDVYWVLIPKNKTGWSSRFGVLEGIFGISPSSRVELTPYAAFAMTNKQRRNPLDPFDEETSWMGNAGLDLKMGLGPNLTLDATINPDFGQVEADPAEVNLSAYETFYSERRPFFIEGSQLLRGEGPDYFYSRRIGAPPKFQPSAIFAEQPSNTTILSAAKVTGRLASGLSVGALTAVTEREFSETYDPVTRTYSEEEIEPFSGFGVLRLQQEFGEDVSTIGAILTGVQRDLRTTAARDQLTEQASSGGVDWKLRFDQGTYELIGFAGFSHVRGSARAIEHVQRSSAHYFQRPDAEYLTMDTARTSMTGYTFSLSLEKNSGRHWLWGFGATAESPEFEINDAGRLQTADDIDTYAHIIYRENIPGSVFHMYLLEFSGSNGWNFGWIRQYSSLGFSFRNTLKNFWTTAVYLDYGLRALSDHLTRGGPLMETGAGWNVYATLNSDYADRTRWGFSGSTFSDETGSWNYSFGCSLTIRASGRLDIAIDPSYTRSVNTRQYLPVPDRALVDGVPYVFSTIDQGTLSTRIRVNYAFSPDLTLEVYGEPFAASGNYLGFGEQAAARSRELIVYGSTDAPSIEKNAEAGAYRVVKREGAFSFSDPDFNILSFRSNIVLRWEWMRGSTLYLVWQQDRYGYHPTGSIIGPGDLLRSFDSPGANFIALKISYWLPIT
ncbi:MAG: carbohydrate binding family 9 domain-containing protein [Bacteroidetes bacterium]|nr:carbohydrate binding family 9 domain-containing protein [Bacteroidota bacterium]